MTSNTSRRIIRMAQRHQDRHAHLVVAWMLIVAGAAVFALTALMWWVR